MKQLVIYVLIFLLGFTGFVIAFAPAALVWQLASGDITRQMPNLQVLDVSGTVWSGKAQVRYWNFPATRVSWSVRPLSLLSGRVDLHTVASGDHIHLTADSKITPGHVNTQAAGHIDGQWLNPVATDYGLNFSGKLTITTLTLASDYHWFTGASGNFHWTGGTIIYGTAQGPQPIDLPPLDGTLRETDNQLHLRIVHTSQPLIAIALRRTGWVKVDIKTRLFELANLHWPEGESMGDTALTFEEQLFPAR